MQASLLELDPPDHVRLAALDLLSSMGKLFMPQEIQVNELAATFCPEPFVYIIKGLCSWNT